MLQQRPKPTPDAPRVEYLLGVLRGLSPQGPPPALRDRLELLAFERLRGGAELGRRLRSPQEGLRSWLRPAFVVALLVAIGTVAALVAHVTGLDPCARASIRELPNRELLNLRRLLAAVLYQRFRRQSLSRRRFAMGCPGWHRTRPPGEWSSAFRIPIAPSIPEQTRPCECRCLKLSSCRWVFQ